MQNVKCTSDNHECPEGLDICCQFCLLNYAPCAGKCSGCWDEAQASGIIAEPRVATERMTESRLTVAIKPDVSIPVV